MFPYTFREGQKEALEFIKRNVSENICFDAPTGFGKTAIILTALLTKGPIIWAVRTGNEADRPIEELKVINEVCKKKYFGFSYRGKKDMCLLAREKDIRETDAVAYLCKVKRQRKSELCTYYENFREVNPLKLSKLTKQPLLYSEVMETCSKKEICPYYVQQELLLTADLVSLSYNYIIHDGMSWVIKNRMPFDECFLVVDEAHNLRLIGSINSDEITLNTFRRSMKELEEFTEVRVREVIEKMKNKAEKIYNEMKKMGEEERILNISEFLDFSLDYLDLMKKYGQRIRDKRLSEGKAPRSSLHRLASFWMESIKYMGTRGVEFIATADNDFKIERWDMRSAEILKDKWGKFRGCIFCSGTLKPMQAFAETIGLENWRGKSIKSEFENCRSLIVEGISTRGEELEEREANKYLEVLKHFLEIDANLAVFSASYRIQNRLLPKIAEMAEKKGRAVFVEKQGMSGDEGRKILDGFKQSNSGVLLATMTGRFAEGADFPGKELEGVFLVGIPFDRMGLKTKLYLDYYKQLYGEEKGWYYAYVIPALHRACQALGRALRSKEDMALFVLGDERYKEKIYFRLLPRFVKKNMAFIKLKDFGRVIKKTWSSMI